MNMGLDVWFREDVARALRAAQVAGREAQTGMESEDVPYTEDREVVLSREMAAYWRGYEAALATIGAAFGLTLPGHLLLTDDLDGQLAGTPPSKANGHSQPWDLGVRGEWE
jgi:hypothetical protein